MKCKRFFIPPLSVLLKTNVVIFVCFCVYETKDGIQLHVNLRRTLIG